MTRLYAFLLVLFLLPACKNKSNNQSDPPVISNGPQKIIALGRVEPETKIAQVGAETGGIIKKIYYHEGDTVQKGNVIIELTHDYEDSKLTQAQAKMATQLDDIKNFRAQIGQAHIKEANLKTKLERSTNMYASEAETKQNLDNAQSDYDQAKLEVERLNAALASEQNKIEEIKADIAVAAADVRRRKVVAPYNGIVMNMDLTEGSPVSTGKALFDFAPEADATVICEVDELLVKKLKLGQKAIIRTEGMDDKLDEGEIIYLSNYLKKKSIFSDESSNMEDRRVREVRIKLKGLQPLLINSRVEAVITVE